MTNKEIIKCLSIIKENATNIDITRYSINRYFTLIKDIRLDNFIWVIDEAIKALKEGEENDI